MQHVPTYTLYGERHGDLLPEVLHAESIAERSRLHDWEIGAHRHDLFLQVLLVRSGRGSAVLDEALHTFVAPALIVVPPMSIHSFRFSSDIDGDVVTLMAQHIERLLGSSAELGALLSRSTHLSWPAGDARFLRLDRALQTLLSEWRDVRMFRMAALEPLVTVFLIGVARALLDAGHGEAGGSRRAHSTVQRFQVLVNRSFQAGLELNHYADLLGVSAGHLTRMCRETIGKSALEVLHARLLVEAKRELFYSSLSIKRIALGLGFTDAAYFARWFGQRVGMSPSAFRARASAAAHPVGRARRDT